MDLITIFKQKRIKRNEVVEQSEPQTTDNNKSSDVKFVECSAFTVGLPEPTPLIPIDAKPKRLLLEDNYNEIFQEVLRCEYLCRQHQLQYDRKVYLGDHDLHKRKEFLLDYLYSLVVCLEDSLQGTDGHK